MSVLFPEAKRAELLEHIRTFAVVGKRWPLRVSVNTSIARDLAWIAGHIEHLPGIRLLNAHAWKPSNDDVTVVFVDAASSGGLGIFFPSLDLGFQCRVSELPASADMHINYLELLAVASAIHICALMDDTPHRLAVFSDSLSSFTVDVFSSLRAQPPFNSVDDVLR